MFLDFEQPLADLYANIEKVREISANEDVDVSHTLHELQDEFDAKHKQIYNNLSRWERVQLARHPKRPYTLHYVEQIFDSFMELHGDRLYGDDKSLIGGFAKLNGTTLMLIGHQKGNDFKSRQYRNFGMAKPEGYRKALRLMKLAEKFNKPIVCFIDTPGAYPGVEAEQRGQAQAIAQNLFEMAKLRVPVLSIVIGEGASGGALGIGMGNRVLMLENTWYSVITPESCSSILWRGWEHKHLAAEQLQLTAHDMLRFGFIDDIVPEPFGAAHANPELTAKTLKTYIEKHLNELNDLAPQQTVQQRINKYATAGNAFLPENAMPPKNL